MSKVKGGVMKITGKNNSTKRKNSENAKIEYPITPIQSPLTPSMTVTSKFSRAFCCSFLGDQERTSLKRQVEISSCNFDK